MILTILYFMAFVMYIFHICGLQKFIVTLYGDRNLDLYPNPHTSAHYQQGSSSSNLRILIFLGSNLQISTCRLCSRQWILQDLLNTIPASISMPRKMSLACRERSESWCIMLVSVWQPTSSKDENNTGFRSLRLPFSSTGIQPSLGDNLVTRRGSMVLWWKGIFISYQ